jgi:ribosome recycling factor
MIEQTLSKAEEKMKSSIEALKRELSGIRTGRASPALVEYLKVDYNGLPTPLNHIASITVSGTNMLVIQPWDPGAITTIEKAILKSNLSLTPSSDGHVVKLVIPPLSEERRQELIKMVKKLVEEQKVIIRNIRRDSLDDLKKMEKNKEISEDDLKRGEAKLQKLTDAFIAMADQTGANKETELKQV